MNTHHFSRRTFLRGVGVTMALPWMESLAVWGDQARAATAGSQAPVRLAVMFSGNGFHSREWWAKGDGKDMQLGKVLAPLADFREKTARDRGALQRRSPQGKHPQLADRQPALRRAAGLGRRNPLGHKHRPARRPAARPFDQGAQPGAGLREVEPVGPQELLDALQLAHLVEFADDADAAWSCIRRWPSTACSRTKSARATRACSTRCSTTPTVFAWGSAPPISGSSTSISTRSARSSSGSTGPARRAGSKAGGPTLDEAERAAPARRHSAGHRRPHAADVRHHGPRFPDRHDPRLHAQAQQRPLLAAVPAP